MSLAAARLDLEARRVLVTGSEVVRAVLVQQVLEVVRERAGEEAMRALARGPNLRGQFASVGAAEFLDLLLDAIEQVVPLGCGADDFYEEIGRRAVESIRGTTIGRTMASMSGGDPVRLFQALGSGPSILVAFGERRVIEAASGAVRIAFSGSLLPPRIFAGMYRAMAEGVGAREVQCSSTEPVPGSTEHVIRWSREAS